MAHSIAGAVLAFASVSTIVGGIKTAADYAFQLGQASKNLGVSVESLDIWGNAIQKFGGTTEGFQNTLKNLQDRFGKLKDPVKDLYRLADVFSKMSRIRALKIGQQLGLDQGTILLLQQGRKEVDAIIAKQKELGVVTKQDAEIAEKFNFQWQQTAHAFRTVFSILSSAVLPGLTTFLNFIERTVTYFRGHKDFIVGGFIAIAAVVVARLIPAIVALDLALAPLLFWPAVILALGTVFALLYEDIQVFLRGGDSAIGRILKKWPEVGKAAKEIYDWAIKASEIVIEGVEGIGNAILKVFNAIADAIAAKIPNLKAAFSFISNALGFGDKDFTAQVTMIKKSQDSLDLAYKNPIAGLSSNSISNLRNSNQNTTIQTGPITINTQATDSEGIATSLDENIRSQMRKAQQQFDNGIYA
jgi:hypothetical protein